jgi:hypothetical protein
MSVRKLIYFLTLCSFLFACDSQKYSQLKRENDSLRQEIEFRNNMLIAMNEVNGIADSILNLHGYQMDSAQYRRYLDRITYLHDNLMVSNRSLAKASNDLNASRDEAAAYNLMVMALQDEVTLRDGEIRDKDVAIDKNAKKYQGNLAALQSVVKERDQELVKLKAAIEDIKRLNAAESYFIKAQRLEEKAKRIIFARRKKKETLREALELYHKSYLYGKKEAATRIEGLTKML